MAHALLRAASALCRRPAIRENRYRGSHVENVPHANSQAKVKLPNLAKAVGLNPAMATKVVVDLPFRQRRLEESGRRFGCREPLVLYLYP